MKVSHFTEGVRSDNLIKDHQNNFDLIAEMMKRLYNSIVELKTGSCNKLFTIISKIIAISFK